MNMREAEEKAYQALELGIIQQSQVDSYIRHLLENRDFINTDVSRGVAPPTDSSNDRESPA